MNSSQVDTELIEDTKRELMNWMLQQEITQLENDLSNTISLFGFILTALSLIFLVTAYFMNKIFTKKLDDVVNKSEVVSEDSEKVSSLKKDIETKIKSFNGKYEELIKSEEKTSQLLNGNKVIFRYIEFLEDGLKQLDIKIRFYELEAEIIKLEPRINDDLINNFKWDYEAETPKECFEYYKKEYKNGKQKITSINLDDFLKENNKALHLYDEDYHDGMMHYESYVNEFEDVENYYQVLNKILND